MSIENYLILLILVQIIVILLFVILYKKNLKIIKDKGNKIQNSLNEFDEFIDLSRKVIDEYNITYDLLIKDLESKINELDKVYNKSNRFNNEEYKTNAKKNSDEDISLNSIVNSTKNNEDIRNEENIQIKKESELLNNNKNNKVKKEYIEALKMARDGYDITEIAKKNDIGKGEVKLLLNLKK